MPTNEQQAAGGGGISIPIAREGLVKSSSAIPKTQKKGRCQKASGAVMLNQQKEEESGAILLGS
jgi:hypothetical protein